MKITAGLGSVDDYPMYVEAGQMNVSAGMFHLRGQKNMEC